MLPNFVIQTHQLLKTKQVRLVCIFLVWISSRLVFCQEEETTTEAFEMHKQRICHKNNNSLASFNTTGGKKAVAKMAKVVDQMEAENLNKFREAVQDLHQDDDTLLRFLRAREGDLTKAEEMLRKSVQWRKENNVSSYLNWKAPEEILSDFKFDYLGQDKDGYAVMFLPIGRWCIREKIEKGFKEDAWTFRFWLLESFIYHVEQSPRNQFVIILDLSECSYKKVAHYETIQLLLAAFRDFEANYPERLRAAYVIRAPWVFSYIYAFIKPLLSGHTLSKVKIFDDDATKWKPALQDRTPDEVMAKLY